MFTSVPRSRIEALHQGPHAHRRLQCPFLVRMSAEWKQEPIGAFVYHNGETYASGSSEQVESTEHDPLRLRTVLASFEPRVVDEKFPLFFVSTCCHISLAKSLTSTTAIQIGFPGNNGISLEQYKALNHEPPPKIHGARMTPIRGPFQQHPAEALHRFRRTSRNL